MPPTGVEMLTLFTITALEISGTLRRPIMLGVVGRNSRRSDEEPEPNLFIGILNV
jgi:hypothetical protein